MNLLAPNHQLGAPDALAILMIASVVIMAVIIASAIVITTKGRE